jgi:hypothetical protein
MKLRFTTKDENIKPFVCLRHGQMSTKYIFVLNCLKEHLMKIGIPRIGYAHLMFFRRFNCTSFHWQIQGEKR